MGKTRICGDLHITEVKIHKFCQMYINKCESWSVCLKPPADQILKFRATQAHKYLNNGVE